MVPPLLLEGNSGYLTPSIDALIHHVPTTELLCKFEIDSSPLGRSRFAIVKKVTDKSSKAEFAAKIIKKTKRGCDITKDIYQEVAILQLSLHCPYIVQMHEVYQTSKEIAIILELMQGGELQSLIDKEEKIEEIHVKKYISQVLKGLQYLHDKKIAHLDIKPLNILLTNPHPHGDVKLCDFGISRYIDQSADIREIFGTPDYVAPEILNFDPIGLFTDMWSVGVLTYVLLTGLSPFAGDDKQETYCNITTRNFSFPEDVFQEISNEAKHFIDSHLNMNPRFRPTVTLSLENKWLAVAQAENNECPIEEFSSANAVWKIGPLLKVDHKYKMHPYFPRSLQENSQIKSINSSENKVGKNSCRVTDGIKTADII